MEKASCNTADITIGFNILHANLAPETPRKSRFGYYPTPPPRSDYPAPPMCIEVKAGTDVSEILAYLFATHNSATGLPLPLDMIDQNVGLPRGFTRQFVAEIETNLVRDSELDKFALQNFA